MFKDAKAFSGFSVGRHAAGQAVLRRDARAARSARRWARSARSWQAGARCSSTPRADHAPATFTVLNFPVDDIDARRRRVHDGRRAFEHYEGELQTDEQGHLPRGADDRLVQGPCREHPLRPGGQAPPLRGGAFQGNRIAQLLGRRDRVLPGRSRLRRETRIRSAARAAPPKRAAPPAFPRWKRRRLNDPSEMPTTAPNAGASRCQPIADPGRVALDENLHELLRSWPASVAARARAGSSQGRNWFAGLRCARPVVVVEPKTPSRPPGLPPPRGAPSGSKRSDSSSSEQSRLLFRPGALRAVDESFRLSARRRSTVGEM